MIQTTTMMMMMTMIWRWKLMMRKKSELDCTFYLYGPHYTKNTVLQPFFYGFKKYLFGSLLHHVFIFLRNMLSE